MGNHSKGTRETPTLNRRDFARWLAASAVATTMFQRAHADIPVSGLNANQQCKNTLTILGSNTTVQNFFYDPLEDLLATMENNAGPTHPVGKALNAARGYVHSKYGNTVALWQVYSFDGNVLAPPRGTPTDWKGLYGVLGAPAMHNNLTLPFLSLPDRTVDSSRVYIENLLTGTPYNFQQRLGTYTIQDFFLKSRNRVFPNFTDPNDEDCERYRLVRGAFHLGVFRWSPQQNVNFQTQDDKVTAYILPNDKCYSGIQSTCVQMPGSYCQTDTDGNPTSATDLCP